MSSWQTFQKRISALCRNDAGVSAVEMGITLLPFLLVVLGTAEFGWYFLHTHTMNTAVSEGVRVGATGAVLDDGGGNPLSREDSIKKAILDRVDGVMVIDPANIQIFPVDADWTDPDDPAVVAAAAAGGAGAFMRVRVLYAHEFFTDLVGGFFSGGTGSRQLVSESTYRNENFVL